MTRSVFSSACQLRPSAKTTSSTAAVKAPASRLFSTSSVFPLSVPSFRTDRPVKRCCTGLSVTPSASVGVIRTVTALIGSSLTQAIPSWQRSLPEPPSFTRHPDVITTGAPTE